MDSKTPSDTSGHIVPITLQDLDEAVSVLEKDVLVLRDHLNLILTPISPSVEQPDKNQDKAPEPQSPLTTSLVDLRQRVVNISHHIHDLQVRCEL